MILKIFLLWRIGLLILSMWALLVIQKEPIGLSGLFSLEKDSKYVQSQIQWDGGHYLSIAKFGYLFASDFAFFPLYPLIIRSLTAIIGNEIFWGLLISNLSFFLFLNIINKFLTAKYSRKIAFNVFVTYLFFPSAFFATVFYSESLYLLFVSMFWYSINKKKYLLSAIFISLSSFTRVIGSFLIISFFYNYLNTKSSQINTYKNIIYPFLSATGIIIYMAYLFVAVGNPFQFHSVQALWGRQVTDPITVILSYTWSYFSGLRPPVDYLDYFLSLLFLLILILGRKKIQSSLWIFSILTILIPISTGTLTGMPRYLLSSIGAFIIAGNFLEEKPFLKKPVWAMSLVLQIILYIRFLNGFWVA